MTDTYRTEPELITIFSPTPPTEISTQNLRDFIVSASFWANCNLRSVDPTGTDDDSYDFRIGSFWLNTTSQILWVCLDPAFESAIWTSINSNTINISPLTGNLDADNNNIYNITDLTAVNLIGDGVSITSVLHQVQDDLTPVLGNNLDGGGFSITNITDFVPTNIL